MVDDHQHLRAGLDDRRVLEALDLVAVAQPEEQCAGSSLSSAAGAHQAASLARVQPFHAGDEPAERGRHRRRAGSWPRSAGSGRGSRRRAPAPAASSARVVTRRPSPPMAAAISAKRQSSRSLNADSGWKARSISQLVLLNRITIGSIPSRRQLPSSQPVIWKAPSPTRISGAPAGGELGADPGRHAVAHAGIVAGGGEVGVGDLHGGEQAVADVGGDRHRPVAVEQVVDRRGRCRPARWPRRRRRARAGRPGGGAGAARPSGRARASSASTSAARGMSRYWWKPMPTWRSSACMVRRRSSLPAFTPKLVSLRITPRSRSPSEPSTSSVIAGIAGDAEIGAGQGRVGGGEQAAAHEAGDHRDAQPAGQLGDLGLEPVAAHLDVDHDHRPPGRGQARHDLVGAGGHRVGIGRRGVRRRAPAPQGTPTMSRGSSI